MAINFPSSPTNGDTYSYNGKTWTYDGTATKWVSVNELSGITATVTELNTLDGITADVTELNYVDGVTSAIQAQLDGKASTASIPTDFVSAASGGTFGGAVDVTGEFIADSYNETFVTLSAAATVDVNCETANVFALTTDQNTTFTFSNPPATGTSYGFTLKLTAGGTHTITYPASVDWAAATAPDAPASGETNMLVFITHDGGTTWYGFQAGAALA